MFYMNSDFLLNFISDKMKLTNSNLVRIDVISLDNEIYAFYYCYICLIIAIFMKSEHSYGFFDFQLSRY